MSEQEQIILQYLENSYTGARMLDDISAMTRIARAIEAFEANPTEDIFAVEPKKGKWVCEIRHYKDTAGEFDYQYIYCSECGEQRRIGWRDANYCPNCGARMEKI